MAMAAMGAEHHVLRLKMGAYARGDRFLAYVSVARSVDQPFLV
jgi:hypothetical protein